MLSGRETILRDGKAVGYLTGGGWGYTVGKAIGLGYVRNPDGVDDDYLREGHVPARGGDGAGAGGAPPGAALRPGERQGEGVMDLRHQVAGGHGKL